MLFQGLIRLLAVLRFSATTLAQSALCAAEGGDALQCDICGLQGAATIRFRAYNSTFDDLKAECYGAGRPLDNYNQIN